MREGLMDSAAMQPRTIFIFILFILSILLGCSTSTVRNSDTPNLCVVSTLVTPYFVPLLDTPRKTRGCSVPYKPITTASYSKPRSRHSEKQVDGYMQEVHVIMLQSAADSQHESSPSTPVRLSVNFSKDGAGNQSNAEVLGRLILVLNSDHPVAWELMTNYGSNEDNNGDLYSSPKPLIVVSEGSTVEGNFSFNFSHKAWPNKKALQRYVKKEYPGLASYTEVKGANHMELKVGSVLNPGHGNECNINSPAESHVLSAFSTVQLKTEGCFNEDYIGDNQVDVYIVELDAGGKGNRPNRAPFPVLVQLEGEGIRPVPRNVTLVLKSHQPIRWQFGANGINGNIVVVSDHEDQVENSAVGKHQNLEVRSKPLPDNFPELLLSVTAEFGRPILYAKTGRASTLRLLVGTIRNKAALRSGSEGKLLHDIAELKPTEDEESERHIKWLDEVGGIREGNVGSHEQMQQHSNFPGASFVDGFGGREPWQSALSRLRANMTVDCGKTRITVSFSASLVRELGVTRLNLNDASCVSQSNGTHVYLSSLVTSCGSTSDSDGKVVSSTNIIHVAFRADDENDDEDFEESSGWYGDSSSEMGKIPIVCKYHPHFPKSLAEDPSHISDDLLPEGSGTKMNLYHMELYRGEGSVEHLDFTSSDPSSREAEFDETLFVKAWIDGVDKVQVVTEDCWISNSSNPRASSQPVILLRNSCPVDLSVKIQAEMSNGNNSLSQQPTHGGFSFQVNKEYENMGQFYIHCSLGLCASDRAFAKGNLMMCVDPREYCSSHGLRPYLDKAVSTAQQLATKGPLRPVHRRRRVPIPQVASSPETPVDGQPKIIYVGVSTEVTVGIALASFAIGVGLTGALWCIHMKTDPFRRQADKQLPGARAGVGTGVVTGCNLSPHSGCSSTNSQAAMTAT